MNAEHILGLVFDCLLEEYWTLTFCLSWVIFLQVSDGEFYNYVGTFNTEDIH